MHLTVAELMAYTAEERARWEDWFRANGDEVFSMPIAGTMETSIGQLVMHVFGPELRYVQRLRNEDQTDYRALPHGSVEAVFGFGLQSRSAMRDFIDGLAAADWDRVMEYPVRNFWVRASIRKTICHVYIHEIRHWAQIARLVRERGFEPPGNHDLLMSSALE
jgi:uncharacterized damage-inducible protein DinB